MVSLANHAVLIPVLQIYGEFRFLGAGHSTGSGRTVVEPRFVRGELFEPRLGWLRSRRSPIQAAFSSGRFPRPYGLQGGGAETSMSVFTSITAGLFEARACSMAL